MPRCLRAVLLVLVASSCSPPSPGPGGGAFAGEELDSPLPRPSFTLQDTESRAFDFRRETEGLAVLLFFGYTHCPDVCPVQMANLAAVLRDVPLEVSRRVRVVFVTTDPERDTPERLRSWLGALHPSFIGLRGDPGEINAIETALGVPLSVVQAAKSPEDYFVGHAAQVIAFGIDGPARVVYPWGTRQRDWLLDLPLLVEAIELPEG